MKCNKCEKSLDYSDLNDLEREELKNIGSFTCSDCVNKEMESLK